MTIDHQFHSILENIYISPLELCNLNCHYCYTKKTKNVLSSNQILKFINNYSKYLKIMSSLVKGRIKEGFNLKSVILCGGEVFTLSNFPDLVNTLQKQDIFITIITNGTIDVLDKIANPSNCQLLVSFDGPEAIHDANRGLGNYQKSVNFVKHALSLGFPVEIMYLVTKDSYPYIDTFNIQNLSLTYLTDRLGSLSPAEIINIKSNYPTFPAKSFGCSMISLQSDGHIYGCCESSLVLGSITDNPDIYINNLIKSLNSCKNCKLSSLRGFAKQSQIATSMTPRDDVKLCHGCCHPDFLCGYKKELGQHSCQNVVKLLNHK